MAGADRTGCYVCCLQCGHWGTEDVCNQCGQPLTPESPSVSGYFGSKCRESLVLVLSFLKACWLLTTRPRGFLNPDYSYLWLVEVRESMQGIGATPLSCSPAAEEPKRTASRRTPACLTAKA
jgi:hypothetical protein